MKKTIAVCSISFALFAIAYPAIAQPTKADRPCLRRADIRDVRTALDNHSLFVQDNARKLFTVRLTTTCHFLSQHLAIRFVDFAKSRLACLEPGDGIVSLSDVGSAPRCTIGSIDYFRPAYDLRIRGPRGAG